MPGSYSKPILRDGSNHPCNIMERSEAGLIAGVGLSIFMHLYPLPNLMWLLSDRYRGTEHFLNVKRHEVITDPGILSIRVDASYSIFPMPRFLEDTLTMLLQKTLILNISSWYARGLIQSISRPSKASRHDKPATEGQRYNSSHVGSKRAGDGQA